MRECCGNVTRSVMERSHSAHESGTVINGSTFLASSFFIGYIPRRAIDHGCASRSSRRSRRTWFWHTRSERFVDERDWNLYRFDLASAIFRSGRSENARNARNGDPLVHRAYCVSRIDLEIVSYEITGCRVSWNALFSLLLARVSMSAERIDLRYLGYVHR